MSGGIIPGRRSMMPTTALSLLLGSGALPRDIRQPHRQRPQFTGPGGHVTVGAALRDREVVFFVGDTGPGMSQEDASRLFDRFWQARKADRRGAGLGLSIVKGFVETQGGHVWVESRRGRGTTVFFTLPAATRLAEHRAEQAPPAR